MLFKRETLGLLSFSLGISIFWGGIFVYLARNDKQKLGRALWEVPGVFVDVCACFLNYNNDWPGGLMFTMGSGLHALFMPCTAVLEDKNAAFLAIMAGEILEQLAIIAAVLDRHGTLTAAIAFCSTSWILCFFWSCYTCTCKDKNPLKIWFIVLQITMLGVCITAATEDIRNVLLAVPEIPLGLVSFFLILTE